MGAQITVSSIYKSYKTIIRGEGFRTSVHKFFRRKYDFVPAVQDLSFDVNEGEIFGLVGLNGAGKTTAIKMISGIMKPDAGDIRVLGEDPFRRSKTYRQSVALVMGQKGQLDMDLSILDSVMLYAQIYSLDITTAIDRTHQMASELQLTDNDLRKQVRSLSLGQRMKGELILSFVHLPKIIFLDEPTLGLDFLTQRAIRNYLINYKEKYKASIILTSHYINDIEELCDMLLIMHKGNCIYTGTIEALKKQMPSVRKTSFTSDEETVIRLRHKLRILIEKNPQGQYVVKFDQEETPRILHAITNESTVHELNMNDDTLDVLIESLYKEREHELV